MPWAPMTMLGLNRPVTWEGMPSSPHSRVNRAAHVRRSQPIHDWSASPRAFSEASSPSSTLRCRQRAGPRIVRSASVKKLALLLPAFEQRPRVLPGRLEAQIVEVSAVAARASSSIRTRSSGQNAPDPRLPASDAERQRVSDPPTLALQRRERAR